MVTGVFVKSDGGGRTGENINVKRDGWMQKSKN